MRVFPLINFKALNPNVISARPENLELFQKENAHQKDYKHIIIIVIVKFIYESANCP